MSQEQLNLLTLTAEYNKICAEYAKLANESKKDEEDDSGDECSSHPAYYCDGGCGKKVGDGNDDECKRYCVDCAIPDEEKESICWCPRCKELKYEGDDVCCRCGRCFEGECKHYACDCVVETDEEEEEDK